MAASFYFQNLDLMLSKNYSMFSSCNALTLTCELNNGSTRKYHRRFKQSN